MPSSEDERIGGDVAVGFIGLTDTFQPCCRR
jgi:hypothetical protein